MLILPGNHNLNAIDRADPARLDLPTSPKKRLQNCARFPRWRLCKDTMCAGSTMTENPATLQEYVSARAADIATSPKIADRFTLTWKLADLWPQSFPMVLSRPTSHSIDQAVSFLSTRTPRIYAPFTNAPGLVCRANEGCRENRLALSQRELDRGAPPSRCGISQARESAIGTHRHRAGQRNVVCPRCKTLNGRAVVMHGHRHIDWIGQCSNMTILSTSPVMDVTNDRDTSFSPAAISRTRRPALAAAA